MPARRASLKGSKRQNWMHNKAKLLARNTGGYLADSVLGEQGFVLALAKYLSSNAANATMLLSKFRV